MQYPQKLDTKLNCDSCSLSIGQKAHICVARALIKRSKIVVLDEATANLDLETDAQIQKCLRQHFNCTVLTIAHRINTIIDYDKILVLSCGRVEEFDTCKNLLKNDHSLFSKLVDETGQQNAEYLRSKALKVI